MTDAAQHTQPIGGLEDGSFDLKATLAALWRRRGFIFLVCTLFAAVSLVFAFLLPHKFVASTVLLPADSEDLPSSLPSSLLGLASIAGLEGVGGDAMGQEAMLTLRSREFLYSFIEQHGIRQQLFPRRWDADRKTWKEGSPGLVGKMLARVSAIGAPSNLDKMKAGDGGPSLWQAYERFRGLLNVSQDRQTREIRVTLEWTDPQAAAQWANALVTDLNSAMRATAVEQSTKRLKFLEERLAEEDIVSIRESIAGLIEKELTRIMLATVQQDFSLRVIDPAVVPERKSKPRRLAIVFLGTVAGFLSAAVVACWRDQSSTMASSPAD
jgi:uncharacterized protein involved in exopolysaccharide biosynthesis